MRLFKFLFIISFCFLNIAAKKDESITESKISKIKSYLVSKGAKHSDLDFIVTKGTNKDVEEKITEWLKSRPKS